ncbi:MAG: dynamin family protein [Calditrichaeota bacterium]|nr:dynamin family protein [Calditrichota bacterium]MCB0304739.1 dynamin family protein [Calditrichota bacterium]
MDHAILNTTYARFKFKLDELLKALATLAYEVNTPDLQRVIDDLRSNLNEPFLFVVVGEVKAGKSSFINALLGADICPVDAAPCTDVIQQIVYAPEKSQVSLNEHLRRVALPNEILKTIAIVDTPGTNTIIRHHQEITHKFIPNSDLVMFVFPAKNPHTLTSWELLDFVSEEWRRKVVFVLQQADLARPDELKVNIEKVKEYAIQRGISEPKVFCTSAEWEQNGQPERSGFTEMRRFIQETVTGGNPYRLKLESALATSGQAVKKISLSLNERQQQLARDAAMVENIKNRLSTGERQTNFEVASLIDRLVANYDRIRSEVVLEFEEGLSVLSLFKRSFASLFSKKESVKSWINELQQQFEKRLNTTFEDLANDGAQHFVNGIRQLLQGLIEDLNRIRNDQALSEEIFRRIGDQRREVLEDVRSKVSSLLKNDSFINSLKSDPGSIAPAAMGGGALAIIGAIIMTTTKLAFMDVTGGVLTGIGMLIAAGMLVFKRGKIKRDFRAGLEKGRRQFESELREKLTGKLRIIYEDIDRSFLGFYDFVEQEQKRLAPLEKTYGEIQQNLHTLSSEIRDGFHMT